MEKDPKDCFNEELYRNYKRNDTLINFDNIPLEIRQNIVNEFDNTEPSTKQKLYKYLVEKKMINLLEVIDEF